MKTKIQQLMENVKVNFIKHPKSPPKVCIEFIRDKAGKVVKFVTHHEKVKHTEQADSKSVIFNSEDSTWVDYTEGRNKDVAPPVVPTTPVPVTPVVPVNLVPIPVVSTPAPVTLVSHPPVTPAPVVPVSTPVVPLATDNVTTPAPVVPVVK